MEKGRYRPVRHSFKRLHVADRIATGTGLYRTKAQIGSLRKTLERFSMLPDGGPAKAAVAEEIKAQTVQVQKVAIRESKGPENMERKHNRLLNSITACKISGAVAWTAIFVANVYTYLGQFSSGQKETLAALCTITALGFYKTMTHLLQSKMAYQRGLGGISKHIQTVEAMAYQYVNRANEGGFKRQSPPLQTCESA